MHSELLKTCNLINVILKNYAFQFYCNLAIILSYIF